MLEVARFRPEKRRRLKLLVDHRPELLREVLRLFDVPDYYYELDEILENLFEEEETDTIDCDSVTGTAQPLHACKTDDTDDEIPF